MTPIASASAAPREVHTLRGLGRLDVAIASLALVIMALLPLGEIVARLVTRAGIPGSGTLVQHLTLWVGFLGAAIAAREGKLLSLATTTFIPEGRGRRAAELFAATVAAAVSALLCRAAIDLVRVEREAGSMLALGIPLWVAQLVLPFSFAAIALWMVWRASQGWGGRLIAGVGLAYGLWLAQTPGMLEGKPPWLGLTAIVAATLLGGPIFVLLGGVALLFFLKDGVPIAALPVETYRLAVSPTLAAIPLFTLTGFLLAEGHASTRLLRVFRAVIGWVPGGTAVVCVVVCAFFTAFTGGSGVTILALGALLLSALKQESYRERFSLGLITAGGSLGLLFPPALPVILYGIVAQISIEDLFLGGMLPGFLMLGLAAAWGIREGVITRAQRTTFSWRELGAALNDGKWELLLPVIVMLAIFGGFATLVEAAALTVLYAFITQCFVHRDLSFGRDLPRTLHECVVLVGGVLVILGAAMGLSSYMVDAEVPARLVEWTQTHVHSRWMFLLALNLFLLVVGCLMDIFSATVVVVPLIVPIGQAFGVHPVHLGIIFLANLELGYLTPPVGLNLFLASYRFNKPLLEVARASLPMLFILGLGVLLITYWPWLTTGVLELLGRGSPIELDSPVARGRGDEEELMLRRALPAKGGRMPHRSALSVPLLVLVGVLCWTHAMARTWIIPHVIAKTANAIDNYNFGLRFALADAIAPGGTGDATTVDFYWYDDAGQPVKALGGANVCNPCQQALDDAQPYGVADLRARMIAAGGFMSTSYFGFVVAVAPDQVALQAYGTYLRSDFEMGVDLERTWEVGALETGSATEAFLLPRFLETQGAALGSGANFFNIAYDQQIFGVYTGGLPGQPSPGAGATVDVYLFDEDTNAPLMGVSGAVCNPCSYNLGVGARKFSLNLHTAVNQAGGFVNTTERGYALALVSGESERVLLQAYRFGRRQFDDFHEDGVPMVSVPIPVSLSGAVGVESEAATARLVAAPNPFGSRAALRFTVKRAGTVRATIHDVSGRRLRVLHDGERVAGPQQLLWDGRDEHGRQLGAGSYFARIETPEGNMVTRLVRIQ